MILMEAITEIVIADDHTIFREGIVYLINSTGAFRVTMEAENGNQLLKQLRSLVPADHFPDLCLLDINMPEVNGYDTMKMLSQEFPHLPVIVLSMHDGAFSISNMLKLGAEGFLTKGSSREELLEALSYIRDGGYYISRGLAKTITITKTKRVPGLSDRETEFLSYCHLELSYKEIADRMKISERTVHSFRDNLFLKYDISTRNALVAFAFRVGIISG